MFSEFEPRQNLDQSEMSFDRLLGSVSICMQNFITILHSVKEIGPFSLFRIWSSAKPRATKNFISQSLGLHLVNINVNAKVYQNIPLSSRDRAIFTFSEFEPRQRLGQSQMAIDNLLGFILSISMRMQILSKYSKRFKSINIFQNLHEQAGDKIFTNCPVTKSNV